MTNQQIFEKLQNHFSEVSDLLEKARSQNMSVTIEGYVTSSGRAKRFRIENIISIEKQEYNVTT